MEKCTDQLPSFMQNNGEVYTEDDHDTLERSIMTGLQELYFSKMLCDFTIVVEGQRLQCHRVVLSSVSRYFYSMFTCCLKESRKGEVVLLEISASVMQAVLHFIYTGEASLNLDNIEELFTVSSRLMITLLQNLCSRCLNTKKISLS
ncbi:kelch-like protein 30 [Discoglossus pictus]